jgi:hypothetical protein
MIWKQSQVSKLLRRKVIFQDDIDAAVNVSHDDKRQPEYTKDTSLD